MYLLVVSTYTYLVPTSKAECKRVHTHTEQILHVGNKAHIVWLTLTVWTKHGKCTVQLYDYEKRETVTYGYDYL